MEYSLKSVRLETGDRAQGARLLAIGAHRSFDRQAFGAQTDVRLSIQPCNDLEGVLTSLRADEPDLVLLNDDGLLPNPALVIIKSVRTSSDVPCVLRSLRVDDEQERVDVLEAGCDDWISHEASETEVKARLRAVLRRTLSPRRPIQSRAWRLSPERRELYGPDGRACELTSAEFDLLHTLVQHRGAVVSREALSQAVFRRAWYPQDRGIDNLAARLRRKLSPNSRNAQVVKPVRGIGYAFTGF
jgi:two-component system phosphate regulon response regulator OmpR